MQGIGGFVKKKKTFLWSTWKHGNEERPHKEKVWTYVGKEEIRLQADNP